MGFQINGAADRIRTCDRPLRRRMLYPAELRLPIEKLKRLHPRRQMHCSLRRRTTRTASLIATFFLLAKPF